MIATALLMAALNVAVISAVLAMRRSSISDGTYGRHDGLVYGVVAWSMPAATLLVVFS